MSTPGVRGFGSGHMVEFVTGMMRPRRLVRGSCDGGVDDWWGLGG